MSDTPFYDSGPWRTKRRKVIKDCNRECQICKARGRHSRAVIVHHVFHLEDYPQWGLLEFVPDPATGKPVRNLLPVCRQCHETVCHPERMRRPAQEPKQPLTPERW